MEDGGPPAPVQDLYQDPGLGGGLGVPLRGEVRGGADSEGDDVVAYRRKGGAVGYRADEELLPSPLRSGGLGEQRRDRGWASGG